MSKEAVVKQDLEQIVDEPDPPPTAALRKQAAHRFRELAAAADPRQVTDQSMTLLLRDWGSAQSTEAKAKKMLADARAWKERVAEAIVAHLGTGEIRYKGTLYAPKIVGGKFTLKPLKAKRIP